MAKKQTISFFSFRQQKLEEALLFSGMFQDALQSLFDWLEAVEPSLSSETAIMGDTQTVNILVDNHKVNYYADFLPFLPSIFSSFYLSSSFP